MLIEIILPGFLVVFLTFMVTTFLVLRYEMGINKSLEGLRAVVDYAAEQPPCTIDNLSRINEKIIEMEEPAINNAWLRFRQDTILILGGELVPEPDSYFNYGEIYGLPRSERNISALWLILFVMSCFVFFIPIGTAAMSGYVLEDLIFSLGVSFFLSGMILLILIGFFAHFTSSKTNAERELFIFVKTLEAALPVAAAASQTGLILEGIRQNNLAFDKTSKDIGNSLEHFATHGITPKVVKAFETSIRTHLAPSINDMRSNLRDLSSKVVRTQTENMQILADSFSEKLATSVDKKISDMCNNVDYINDSMKEIRESMKLSINTLYTSLEADRRALSSAMERVEEVTVIQKSASENISVLSKHLEATGQLVETLNSWDMLIKESANVVSESMKGAIESNVETAKALSDTMESLANAGSEQYEKAAEAAAKLLNDIVVEMNRAMDGVGHEIAESITKASADSVDIIDRLAEKTGQLKEEYDTYFQRVENQSKTGMDDMDYHMQSVIGRFSEEAIGIMDRLESNITKAMGMFEGNTAELLSSLEEQSRSIGLYAHDLNIDINELSNNLKESVKVFNEQLHNGVQRTFQDFDGGLTEVSHRLANTIETIRESVENLPKALKNER